MTNNDKIKLTKLRKLYKHRGEEFVIVVDNFNKVIDLYYKNNKTNYSSVPYTNKIRPIIEKMVSDFCVELDLIIDEADIMKTLKSMGFKANP